MSVRVAVIGGGLAGLFTAIELMAAGIDDVVVVDRASAAGGVARTIKRDGYSLEPAAGSVMLPHPHLSPLVERIGATMVPAEGRGLRYVYTGNLIKLAPSPKLLLAPIAPLHAKLRGLAEPLVRTPIPSTEESLHDFMLRRFGTGLGDVMASLAASGVFAGDPARLSAQSAFPMLTALESNDGSVIRGGLARRRAGKGGIRPTAHTPLAGMSGIADLAAEALGERYIGNREITAVQRTASGWSLHGDDPIDAEHVVLACDPLAASRLMGGELGRVLRDATRAPVVVVGFGGRSHRFPLPQGFGILTTPSAGLVTLGLLLESSYAPHRAPAGHSLLKMIAGGARRPDVAKWTDERIIEVIGGEVVKVLGVDIEASFVEVTRHQQGIPQYEIGHRSWLGELDRLTAAHPGLHLTGWGYRGVGVGHVASDAHRVARTIIETT